MSKEKKIETRVIYKKDHELSKEGYIMFVNAKIWADGLREKYPEPGHRVRVRSRSRTSTWDVVVKVRTEVQ